VSRPTIPIQEMKYILATDVGSTTTKARFFSKTNEGWRYVTSGEAPTTVEAPYEDVTLGVINAVREVEELTNHRILSRGGRIIRPSKGNDGVDLYCTTSSAGGGLQMLVAGVMRIMTGESANRAALGAGAIVMDIISQDDGRQPYERIRKIRYLRPDMILLAGGTDGGSTTHVVQIAETISAAEPKARLGAGYELPLVYAGNKDIRPKIEDLMGKKFALTIVDNLRPSLETENAEPTRAAIHELFMEHVMSHAPGYDKLMKWTDVDIMPTPAGEGIAMQVIAENYKTNVIGVGLGGATTNVYSVVEGKFVRSVSANLGMSYSVCNVMKETGVENILRWIPFQADANEIKKRLMNKMTRPTTIPQTLEDMLIEHATAREALRLGLKHHKTIATRLKGVALGLERTVSDVFDQTAFLEETYIKMMNIGIIAGTGGLLSHAPKRTQSMLILIDGFQPEGVTRIFQDSVFMMPHLGVLSTVHKEAASQIFDKDCLVRVGTVIAPVGEGKEGESVMTVAIEMPDGNTKEEEVSFGEIKKIPFKGNEAAKVQISPRRGFDVGAGQGRKREAIVTGGEVGIVLDGRGRPLRLPDDSESRIRRLLDWLGAMECYDPNRLSQIQSGK